MKVFESSLEEFTEFELRFRIAQCLEEIKQIPEALAILTQIPIHARVPKVNALLEHLLQFNHTDKSALVPLKAIVRECPLNLNAIQGLLALEMTNTEVMDIISESNSFYLQFKYILIIMFIT